jgi:ABC-type protease/lipase transport system fused ATPase/permease subunit
VYSKEDDGNKSGVGIRRCRLPVLGLDRIKGTLMQAKAARKTDEITDILKGSRGALMSAGFFSGIVNLLMLTGPLFMLQVYDRVLSSGSVPTLVALAVITLGLYVYYGFLEYVRSRIMVRIGRRIEESLRTRVFDTVATLAMRKGANAGGQPIADLATIRQYLGGQGPIAFLDMPWVPLYLIIVFLMHWMLGAVAAVSALVIFVLAVMTELRTRGPTQRANTASVKAQLLTEEVRRNSETWRHVARGAACGSVRHAGAWGLSCHSE